jgi:predicted DNA-binding protein
MSVTIELPPETEKQLRARAAAVGRDVSAFVLEAVEEKLRASERTFDEILAPIRQGFTESGMSEEEIDELGRQALAEVRAEKRKARS